MAEFYFLETLKSVLGSSKTHYLEKYVVFSPMQICHPKSID